MMPIASRFNCRSLNTVVAPDHSATFVPRRRRRPRKGSWRFEAGVTARYSDPTQLSRTSFIRISSVGGFRVIKLLQEAPTHHSSARVTVSNSSCLAVAVEVHGAAGQTRLRGGAVSI